MENCRRGTLLLTCYVSKVPDQGRDYARNFGTDRYLPLPLPLFLSPAEPGLGVPRCNGRQYGILPGDRESRDEDWPGELYRKEE